MKIFEINSWTTADHRTCHSTRQIWTLDMIKKRSKSWRRGENPDQLRNK